MSSKVPGEMAYSLFQSIIEAVYISLMVLPGVNTSDVNMSCEAFVENAYSTCTCAVNRDAVSAVGKCQFTVGYVVLELSSASEKRTCKFSDVFQGLKQPSKIGFSSCKLVQDGFPNNVYTMQVSLLTRKSELPKNSTAFVCNLNCFPVNSSNPLDYYPPSRTLPVVFSPNCTPGIFGELCNETCDPFCVNGVCDREWGNCTKSVTTEPPTPTLGIATIEPATTLVITTNETTEAEETTDVPTEPTTTLGITTNETSEAEETTEPKPEEKDSKLTLALAIGVPALAGAVGFLSWFCGRCSAVLDLIQSSLPAREESESGSDSESSSSEGKSTGKASATQIPASPPPEPSPPSAPIPVVVVDETTSGVSLFSPTSYGSSTSGSSSGISIATSVASVPVAKREDSTMSIKPSSSSNDSRGSHVSDKYASFPRLPLKC